MLLVSTLSVLAEENPLINDGSTNNPSRYILFGASSATDESKEPVLNVSVTEVMALLTEIKLKLPVGLTR